MIFLDVTKSARSSHRSGLQRVSERLLVSLGDSARPFSWEPGPRPPAHGPGDWLLTPELFGTADRPGFPLDLRTGGLRCAALFHDAIPLRLPAVTWPHSVSRHPGYMKALASFDRVLAVSAASRDELLGFWRWLGLRHTPPVGLLQLGADFDGSPRLTTPPSAAAPAPRPLLLCVGILEPRKNQELLLDLCPVLWDAGLDFELHFVGRVNPHFGKPLEKRLLALARKYPNLHYHRAAPDSLLAALYARASATVFPSLAEGCGLPLLESLWRGVPCLGSDLPPLRENAAGGGCLLLPVNDREAWKQGLSDFLRSPAQQTALAAEARSRPLPTWAACAASIRSLLAAP